MYASHDRPLRLSRLSLYTLTDFMAPEGATPSAMLDSRYCKLKETREYVQQYTRISLDVRTYYCYSQHNWPMPFFRHVCTYLLPSLFTLHQHFSHKQHSIHSSQTLSTHFLTHSPQTPSTQPLTNPSPPIIILQHTSNSHSFFTTLIYIKQFVSKLSNNFEEAEVGTRLAVWVYGSAVLDAKPTVNKSRSQCVGVAVQRSCHTKYPSFLLTLVYVRSVPN